MAKPRLRSSRQRYRTFVEDYRLRRLDQPADGATQPSAAGVRQFAEGKHREYLRDYLNWLWPHRYAAGGLMLLAAL